MFKPSKVIGADYLLRWHLIPRNRFFNIYLHKFIGSDLGRDMHDHPWWSLSVLLKGRLIECTPCDVVGESMPTMMVHQVRRWLPVIRGPEHTHRVLLADGWKPAWTLFITGPKVREWGFWRGREWVPHNDR